MQVHIHEIKRNLKKNLKQKGWVQKPKAGKDTRGAVQWKVEDLDAQAPALHGSTAPSLQIQSIMDSTHMKKRCGSNLHMSLFVITSSAI